MKRYPVNPMARYVFITGGVVSSLGKGIAAAALGALLQARGYKVRLRKLDPYLNVDPGTMSPTQHGEVYVTDDGAETDLDLGHYRSEEHTSELQSLMRNSYAVFCLKKKKINKYKTEVIKHGINIIT